MKIIQLKAENIKRINAIDITPKDDLVIVGGRNDQGKSSTLDAIEMVLHGERYLPDVPLKVGTVNGKIEADLEDLVAIRKVTAKGTQLIIKNKDGVVQKSPQGILDSLYGTLTFDPAGFMSMDAEKQSATLKQLAGLDLSDLDTLYKETYEKRADLNRSIKDLKGTLATMPDVPATVPDIEVQVDQLMIEQKNIIDINAGNQVKRQKYQATCNQVTVNQENLAHMMQREKKMEQDLEQLRALLAEKVGEQRDLMAKKSLMETALKSVVDVSLENVNRQIMDSGNLNKLVAQRRAREKVRTDLKKLEEQSTTLTQELDSVEADKATRIASVKYPLEGLSVNKEGLVIFDGVPLAQCSSSKRLQVSVAIGIALNPKLRILLIRNGNDLDEDNMKVLADMARTNNMQIWIERVGVSDKASVVIEDGYSKVPVNNSP